MNPADRSLIITPAEARCGVTDTSIPFSIECFSCDAGTEIDSAEQAIAKGWTNIQPDNGAAWNYLGDCPDCLKDEAMSCSQLELFPQ